MNDFHLPETEHVSLITAGNADVELGIAAVLMAARAAAVIAGRNPPRTEPAVERLETRNPDRRALGLIYDVADGKSVDAMVARAVEEPKERPRPRLAHREASPERRGIWAVPAGFGLGPTRRKPWASR